MNTESSWQKAWRDAYENEESVCECGAEKLQLGPYSHAQWCKLYKKPLVSEKCECGPGPWHSIHCRFRVVKSEPPKNNYGWPKIDIDSFRKD